MIHSVCSSCSLNKEQQEQQEWMSKERKSEFPTLPWEEISGVDCISALLLEISPGKAVESWTVLKPLLEDVNTAEILSDISDGKDDGTENSMVEFKLCKELKLRFKLMELELRSVEIVKDGTVVISGFKLTPILDVINDEILSDLPDKEGIIDSVVKFINGLKSKVVFSTELIELAPISDEASKEETYDWFWMVKIVVSLIVLKLWPTVFWIEVKPLPEEMADDEMLSDLSDKNGMVDSVVEFINKVKLKSEVAFRAELLKVIRISDIVCNDETLSELFNTGWAAEMVVPLIVLKLRPIEFISDDKCSLALILEMSLEKANSWIEDVTTGKKLTDLSDKAEMV